MARKLAIASAVLSGILIAAHFIREGGFLFAVLGLMLPWFLLLEPRWATRTVQVFLVLCAAEWAYALYVIAAERQATGQPWLRMAIILGSVTLFTLFSAFAAGRWGMPPGNEPERQA